MQAIIHNVHLQTPPTKSQPSALKEKKQKEKPKQKGNVKVKEHAAIMVPSSLTHILVLFRMHKKKKRKKNRTYYTEYKVH